MNRFSRLATVGAVVAVGIGAGATTAGAYSISGGAYVGSATATHAWTFGGVYTTTCPAFVTTYAGNATGAGTTSFTPDFGGAGACDLFGYSSSVTQVGSWNLEVISGPDGSGFYYGELTVPAGTSTMADTPIAGCAATVSGPQTFRHGISSTVIRMANVTGGISLEMDLNGIAYGASGTCFTPGTGGMYSTNGVVDIPGVTIS